MGPQSMPLRLWTPLLKRPRRRSRMAQRLLVGKWPRPVKSMALQKQCNVAACELLRNSSMFSAGVFVQARGVSIVDPRLGAEFNRARGLQVYGHRHELS